MGQRNSGWWLVIALTTGACGGGQGAGSMAPMGSGLSSRAISHAIETTASGEVRFTIILPQAFPNVQLFAEKNAGPGFALASQKMTQSAEATYSCTSGIFSRGDRIRFRVLYQVPGTDPGWYPSASELTPSYVVGEGADTGEADGSGAGNPGTEPVTPPEAPSQPGAPSIPVISQPDPSGVVVAVANHCPFSIWVRAVGGDAVLQPDNAEMRNGTFRKYIAPRKWPAARVTAYADSSTSVASELDKVEMTFDPGANNTAVLNYNITYVDWLGLPSLIEGFGTGSDCKRSGCNRPLASVLGGCPDGLQSGKKCLSAGMYCLNPANASKEICTRLDGKIAQCARQYPGCAGASGSRTAEVYSCSGPFFSQQPLWCAALNRGMLDEPNFEAEARYYSNSPYNTYAKWVHGNCGPIYAFPYDDVGPNVSSFHSCIGGRQLNIIFCPQG
jgi:hypothetical protein